MKNVMVSEVIAKEIITLDNGQNVGYVLDVCFDNTLSKVLGYVVADEESERENFLPKVGIKLDGEDCIFIENSYKQELNFSGFTNNPIGKKVYSDKGGFLGIVKDVICENFTPIKLITTICEIPSKNIYSNGSACLFFSEKKKKKNKNINKFNFASDNFLPKAETQNIQIQNSKFQIASTNNNKIANPSKVMLAPSSLLNKTATCDIYGLNNELIIKEGQIINQTKIDKARKHGKINLLILNSK